MYDNGGNSNVPKNKKSDNEGTEQANEIERTEDSDTASFNREERK